MKVTVHKVPVQKVQIERHEKQWVVYLFKPVYSYWVGVSV